MGAWVALVLLAALVAAAPAAAGTFRFVGPDGTVHYTNVPTDPKYQRPQPSGSATGWLRLPRGDTRPYAREIKEAAARYAIPEELLMAVIRVESGFNPRAVSPKGARGLMQLMPQTASFLGVRNSFDPRQNIDGGARHLRGLMELFPDDLGLVLAAYNAGAEAVLTHRGVPPFAETRDYVARVLKLFRGPLPRSTYVNVGTDGTIVYTNIPPPGGL